MLLGDVAHEAVPSRDARRPRDRVIARIDAARGRRRGEEDHRRAVEREQRAGKRVPGVLADEHREPAPRRIEGANVVAALDETLFVEQTVGGQEVLAVHVPDERRVASESHPQRAVVEDAVPRLVKADRDLERLRSSARGQIHALQIACERARRARVLAHAALEEVAGERRFG